MSGKAMHLSLLNAGGCVRVVKQVAILSCFLALTSTAIPAEPALSPVTDEMLKNPPASDWLAYRANYSSWGFSQLDQINQANVHGLALAWVSSMDAGSNESTPLVHDGVLFLPHPGDVIEALDGRHGGRLWIYRRQLPPDTNQPNSKGGIVAFSLNKIKRNIAIYGQHIFMLSRDQDIVALDMKSGHLAWQVPVGDYHEMIATSGPIVADGKIITGRSCDATFAGGCFVTAHDAQNGNEIWRRYLIPRPGEPGDETWKGLPVEKRVHVGAWGVASYDPELGLIYLGTSTPAPSVEILRGTAGGDVLYSNSTLALDVKTGKIAWYFQHLPRDNWDMDHVFERILVDIPLRPDRQSLWSLNPTVQSGVERRVMTGVPGKTGIVWTLDRKTGEFLWARPTVKQNFITAVDERTGKPTVNEDLILKSATDQYPVSCPSNYGGKDWPVSAYSPQTRAIYIPLLSTCAQIVVTTTEPKASDVYGIDQNLKPAVDGNTTGWLEAVSIETGKTLWRHQQPGAMLGALTTAGHLVFAGDSSGRFMAFNSETGKILWATQLHAAVSGTPISYSVGGAQYVAVAVGGHTLLTDTVENQFPLGSRTGSNALYVFRLPPSAPDPSPLDADKAAERDSDGAMPYLKTDVTAGSIFYRYRCASCHGNDFHGGGGHVPALTGCAFAARWEGKTMQQLFDKIGETMPPASVAPLDHQTVANILAYWSDTQKADATISSDTSAWSTSQFSAAFGQLCPGPAK